MSNLIPRVVSTILASILACAASASLEKPECPAGCEAQPDSVCFFQGQFVPDMKVRIGFQL
jgi:hypothetical protein